ncbi:MULTISPECIES: signal peptidase II [Marinomonas]|uniref:Lipoprotein signal peptidase n=1 Tax=Marinomonas fungiae TaxID=1137284 RepID=A0A0K6IUE3_9GAMM|nr:MULTISPECIES: signal peptidase II [Marinomonas]CUB06731.1 lipoprotein signal peptidase [Marinomonas fungiae]
MIKNDFPGTHRNRGVQILLVSMLTLALDQLSKWIALAYLLETPRVIEVTAFFNLRLGFNTGVSFGLFRDFFANAPELLALISLAIVAVLLIWAWRSDSFFERISLAVIAGGALGNIVDRWRQGAVTDFLDFHWAGWHWPTFNGADIFITLGAICLLLSGLRRTDETDWKEKQITGRRGPTRVN